MAAGRGGGKDDLNVAIGRENDMAEKKRETTAENDQNKIGSKVELRLVATLPAFPHPVTAVAFMPAIKAVADDKVVDNKAVAVAIAVGGHGGVSPSYHGEKEEKEEKEKVNYHKKEQETNKAYAVAVGLEDGSVEVWRLRVAADSDRRSEPKDTPQKDTRENNQSANYQSQQVWKSDVTTRHGAVVRSMCWRAVDSDERSAAEELLEKQGRDPKSFFLATCSDDHAVKVFRVPVSGVLVDL